MREMQLNMALSINKSNYSKSFVDEISTNANNENLLSIFLIFIYPLASRKVVAITGGSVFCIHILHRYTHKHTTTR